jgi:hypothetical protein
MGYDGVVLALFRRSAANDLQIYWQTGELEEDWHLVLELCKCILVICHDVKRSDACPLA